MLNKGFNLSDADGQHSIDIVMPEELKDIFYAKLYCRSSLMDISEGDPVRIWDLMSCNFNNIKLVAPHQVHGTNIINADNKYSLPLRPEADGVYINQNSDCPASLRFADCTPVVVVGLLPEPWMVILHSGFTGTMKNIIHHAIAPLSANLKPLSAQTWAWIGPSICKKCYSRRSTDPKTEEAISKFSAVNYYEKEDMIYFDIKNQLVLQLMQTGVPCDNIYKFEACTFCDRDIFYSYRGGDINRRNFLLAGNTTK